MSATSFDIREALRDRARERRVEIMDRSGLSNEEASVMATLDVVTAEIIALTKRAEAAEAERDVLAEKWGGMVDDNGDPLDASGILEYVCTLREELSHMQAERDALRKDAAVLREFVSSDEIAMTYQTMKQYRAALLKFHTAAMAVQPTTGETNE